MTSEKHQEGLDFEKAKELTVEEAVQKEAELKVGITDEDDVLDKYIKRHRTEVASQKFDGTSAPAPQKIGDTAPLDEFIHQQRQLFEEELVTSEPQNNSQESEAVSESETTSSQVGSETPVDLEKTVVFDLPPVAPPNQESSEQASQSESEESPAISSLTSEPVVAKANKDKRDIQNDLVKTDTNTHKAQKKSRKIVWYSLATLVVLGAATTAWYTRQGTSKSSSTTTSSSSETASAKKANTSFNQAYRAFFTDDSQTKLKNSQFDQLPQLKKALDKLKNTSYYTNAKKKYDSLNRQITAIRAVNALFQSDAINDGEKTGAKVKSDANFDSLSSDSLNTGNAALDKLLQEVIADGRSQQTPSTSTAQDTGTSSTAAADTTQGSATTDASTNAAPATSGDSNAATTTTTSSAATPYGIQSYDESTLQKSLSRVPINENAIADSTNSAWDWTPGVLEKIVATSQERGYITGNNYILQKVNIINGNGYYNMYKPDGTYLFSINCKTGYFVGNAAGHSDALDY
ncbi:cell division site-positioning protein MapZ family protein [Streptococcus sp. DD12]|uniref:cell division site-positioning protein MapZ family protein n=1 Tax=Streptococcus sp. DD12 TaxID=1777880 RepID=UPI00079CA01B|nr:cell division site-positioning protein MapZ family protein [Streptococcus sp. DD12]KXT75268.1 hypothetical protein STRDD12_01534 [Streptococcus sp. DD12]